MRNIELEGAHAALYDARAAAHLLLALMAHRRGLVDEVRALAERARPIPTAGLGASPRTCQRTTARARRDPSYVERLAAALPAHPELSSQQNSYLSMLDFALDDLVLANAERQQLEGLALDLGLDRAAVQAAHQVYFDDLFAAALRDGQVTKSERDQLEAVAGALGFGTECEVRLEELGDAPTCSVRPGMLVCFTGDAEVMVGGKMWTRELAEVLAVDADLVPRQGVSRKVGLVIAGDTTSMSTKARQARQYGIPVISVPEFLDAIGVSYRVC